MQQLKPNTDPYLVLRPEYINVITKPDPFAPMKTPFVSAVLIIAILITNSAGATSHTPKPLEEPELKAKYKTAVVKIEVLGERGGIVAQPEIGSGFIIHKQGFILTNAHVVKPKYFDKVTAINVIQINKDDQTQAPVPAQVIKLDEEIDVALIKIPGKDLPSMDLGDSNEVADGEQIVIFGNPLGGQQATSGGNISGKDDFKGYFQTGAIIYPGNSGGPVVERKRGKVVAIAWGGRPEFPGINFVIPINYANHLIRLVYRLTNRFTIT